MRNIPKCNGYLVTNFHRCHITLIAESLCKLVVRDLQLNITSKVIKNAIVLALKKPFNFLCLDLWYYALN